MNALISKRHIIVKCRSSASMVIICKILGELMSYGPLSTFDLYFVMTYTSANLQSNQCIPAKVTEGKSGFKFNFFFTAC